MGSRTPYHDSAMPSLRRKTSEELARGECRGPFSAADFDARHPQGWFAAKRFGFPQKDDYRPCEDYPASGQCSTSEIDEIIDTEGPDSITGTAKARTKILDEVKVSVELSDGTVLRGKRHSASDSKTTRELLAQIIDL